MSKSKYSDKTEQLQVVLEELVQKANEVCQFSQRNTPLNAERFVQTLVLGWLRRTDASLNELAQTAEDLGSSVTGSAINERLGTEAIELLGRVLVGALRQVVQYPRLPVADLECFTAIHVTDSTQIALPTCLRDEFRGGNDNAMVKLQVTMDYLTGQWVALEMSDGKASDSKSELPVQQAQAGSLNVFDLGYFKQEHLRDIDNQEAYFVSRYQSQTALYEVESGERFNLVTWLQTLTGHAAECEVELGSRVRLKVRLVVRRLTQKAADARRRKAKKRYKHDGKTCSKVYLYLLGWDILITNLADEAWSSVQIFDLYPIRTQIEWLFRVWKSELQVDHFGNWRIDRVLCQLYAHLIAILLCHRLSAGWLWRAGQEYSFYKCVQIIQDRIGALMRCIARHWWGAATWCRQLEAAFRQFARKTKRKKTPSTLQTLINQGLS
jgi:hypothetical protein